jgi:hypothetical protein
MANQTQPTPGNRPQNNPQDPRSQNPQQPTNPPGGMPSSRPQTAGGKKDDETKLPIGDTTGEMEDSGGGRKSSGNSIEPSRSGRSGSITTAPARSNPIEPQKSSGESSDVERDSAAVNDRSRSKQQGC